MVPTIEYPQGDQREEIPISTENGNMMNNVQEVALIGGRRKAKPTLIIKVAVSVKALRCASGIVK
jgi:hypothetical protein